jgi:hypothetical protein
MRLLRMLVLDREYHGAWRAISSDALRYWLRVWADGCFTASHPEWGFSPLTLTGLGRLWPYFVQKPGERDWGQWQRHAIRVLASRRSSFPDGSRFRCPTGQDEHQWNEYWAHVLGATEAFRAGLFERLSALLTSTDAPDYDSILKTTTVLGGNLLLEGYSNRELWLRADGVFDPKATKTMAPIDRALGLLDHLKRRPTTEYLVWTDIVRNRQPLSNKLSRRIAPLAVQSPEEWSEGEGFVRIDGSTIAISRIDSTHSITAFINHRASSWVRLREQCAKFGVPALGLAEVSWARQLTLMSRPPWQYTFPRKTFDYLPRPNPAVESTAFAAAIEATNDDPEETVRVLCDAFERQLGGRWPEPAGRAYIDCFQSGIRRLLRIAIRETQKRWEGHSAAPKWFDELRTDEPFDFAQISSSIRNSGPDADCLFAERLELAARNATQYVTPGCVTGWLFLAKGIRNHETHHASWPLDLRCISAFVARLLVQVFVTTFPQPRASGAAVAADAD